MPGVPDFYQGTELWDLSLVDPDKSPPGGFRARAAALGEVAADPDWNALTAAWPDGRIKLALTRELLALRKRASGLVHGRYVPTDRSAGRDRDHVIAFARTLGRRAIVVAVGRLFAPLTEGGRHLALARRVGRAAGARGIRFAAQCAGAGEFGDHPWRAISRLFDPLPVAILLATIRRTSEADSASLQARGRARSAG